MATKIIMKTGEEFVTNDIRFSHNGAEGYANFTEKWTGVFRSGINTKHIEKIVGGKDTKKEDGKVREQMKCPNCKVNIGHSKFCGLCGTKAEPVKFIKCPECGERFADDCGFLYCTECGRALRV